MTTPHQPQEELRAWGEPVGEDWNASRGPRRAARFPPLRADAERYHGVYGEYGISVLAAREATVDELAQAVPLVRFETPTLVRAGALHSAGIRLDPTGRNPQHFTLVFDDLVRGVDALVFCEHGSWVNPYHER